MENSGILKHLGIIKNELLIFATLGQVMTHGSGAFLDNSTVGFQIFAGVVLHLCGAGILVLFGGFYFFALMRLPSSVQELKFEKSLEEAIEDHEKVENKPAKSKEPKRAAVTEHDHSPPKGPKKVKTQP